jgi:hypothetical protein
MLSSLLTTIDIDPVARDWYSPAARGVGNWPEIGSCRILERFVWRVSCCPMLSSPGSEQHQAHQETPGRTTSQKALRNRPAQASPDCGSGGIGRRTSLRGWRSQERGGSSPPFRTTHSASPHSWRVTEPQALDLRLRLGPRARVPPSAPPLSIKKPVACSAWTTRWRRLCAARLVKSLCKNLQMGILDSCARVLAMHGGTNVKQRV